MTEQRRPGKYPDVVRRQAVRLVTDHRGEYESEWAAITSIAAKLGMTAETLRKCVLCRRRHKTQFPKLVSLIPNSRATTAIGFSDVRTISTASCLNSSENRFRLPIEF